MMPESPPWMVPCPSAATLWPACSSKCEIHADLWPGSRCHTVLPRSKWTRLPTMSTIDLVDPELRDALALWPQMSLTAETLTRRRADALALLSSVSDTRPARHRDGRDPRRECVWCETDPR